jgi:ribulose-phosphate 3-epimerase
MTAATRDDLISRARGISLGILAADLGDLRHAAQNAAGWGCEILHFDVMDGVFVPQMFGGPSVVAALDVGLLRDVHLMVQNPAQHVDSYIKAGADMITVHAEANDAAKALDAIRAAATAAGRPVLAGVALMPGTSDAQARDVLALAPDMLLILSLDPRDASAPDIARACARLSALKTAAGPTGPVMAFDGGVTMESIAEIARSGADIIVSGSAILRAPDPEQAFNQMARAL